MEKELKELLEQRKAITERINRLVCKDIVSGDITLKCDMRKGEIDGYYASIKYLSINRTILSADTENEMLEKIRKLIGDLQGIVDVLENDNEQSEFS